MPGAQCTRSLVCAGGSKYAHQYSQRRHRKTSGIPHAMVFGLLRALPGDHRFVDPVIRATRWRLANLTPASGRQNHTASPSATASARRTLRRVHRIPPNVPDDRDTPLLERRDGGSRSWISEKRKNNFGGKDGQISRHRRARNEAGLRFAEPYGFAIHDAMIIASALHAGCDTLWSEDMQHGMTLDEGLRIVSPFRDAGKLSDC